MRATTAQEAFRVASDRKTGSSKAVMRFQLEFSPADRLKIQETTAIVTSKCYF